MYSFLRWGASCWLACLWLLAYPVAAQNIALNKPATATSSQGGFPPKQVNDGDANTRWGSEYDTKLTTIAPDSNSIYIDLQGIGTITQVYLNWETALGKNFKIEVSNDAKTWTGILKVTGNNSKTNTLAVSGTGRYVRMHGLQRGTVYGYSLWEFQVTGTLAPLPLPVSLVAFSAARQNSAVALRWTTATELNNTGFEVQRSTNGVAFASLAFVPGAGDSQSLRTYSYLDTPPAGTTSYYRLKQVDADGKVAYSAVQAVWVAPSQVASVFPNPATTQATVAWSATGPGSGRWCLTATTGQVVHTEPLTEQEGPNHLLLDLTLYPAGSYILTVESGGQVQCRTRLQKVN